MASDLISLSFERDYCTNKTLNTYNTKDEIIINEEFHIERPHDHEHLKNFNEIHTFEIENLLIYKTKLSFNYYEGFGGAFENFFLSNWEKFDDEWWQDIVKKIYEISSSFYLIEIDFRQEDEKIIASLPWWLNLEEREDAKNLERPINIYAYIIPIEKYNEFREIYRFVKESSIFIDEKYEIIRSRFSQFYNRKFYSYHQKNPKLFLELKSDMLYIENRERELDSYIGIVEDRDIFNRICKIYFYTFLNEIKKKYDISYEKIYLSKGDLYEIKNASERYFSFAKIIFKDLKDKFESVRIGVKYG